MEFHIHIGFCILQSLHSDSRLKEKFHSRKHSPTLIHCQRLNEYKTDLTTTTNTLTLSHFKELLANFKLWFLSFI
jgi:hypothetical protein